MVDGVIECYEACPGQAVNHICEISLSTGQSFALLQDNSTYPAWRPELPLLGACLESLRLFLPFNSFSGFHLPGAISLSITPLSSFPLGLHSQSYVSSLLWSTGNLTICLGFQPQHADAITRLHLLLPT